MRKCERISAGSAALASARIDVTVNEIACNDPACPGLETVILVMREGAKTRAYKSRGSALVQTRPEIEAALLKP